MRSLRLNAFRCGELSTEQGSAKIRKTAAGPGPSAYESGVLEFNNLFQLNFKRDAFIKYSRGLIKAESQGDNSGLSYKAQGL